MTQSIKAILIFSISLLTIQNVHSAATPADTLQSRELDEVVIRANSKETSDLKKVPSASTFIGPAQIATRGLEGVKQISAIAPNLFIPDYGSPLSTPIYIRGIGTRGSGQSVGIYIDDVPMLDKSTFDIRLFDLSSINILRGPQGTLYGRNAMGGVINIRTLSPLEYQGSKLSVGAANANNYSASGSHMTKIGSKVGLGISGYYNHQGGYFRNAFTDRMVDKRTSAGARLRLEWKISDEWRAGLSSTYDWTDGGAFAYGRYDSLSGKIAQTNYNNQGSYKRQYAQNALRFQYKNQSVMFTSTTSHQWLMDDMFMDQDFSDKSIFTLNQRQHMNAVSQEFAVRSVDNKDYQWSVGAYGFYTGLSTDGDVAFGPDGVKTVLQKTFDDLQASNPGMPKITIKDQSISNPGTYKTPTWGAAIFHQSTFNNLFTKGLSFTIGLRLDYERQYLDYNTQMAMNLSVSPRPGMTINHKLDSTLTGHRNQQFLEVLPRVSIKYECTPEISTWFTASKGHRAGGYNIQMFSEVSQAALKAQMPMGPKPTPVDIDQTVSYAPEITWNYEVGTRGSFLGGDLTAELALFYMDIRDLQLTKFIAGGSGRIMTNAGSGTSYGIETSIGWQATKGLHFDANYGYTHATFSNYNAGTKQGVEHDYSGRTIPYTPSHTFTIGGAYALNFGPSSWLDGINFGASYSGAGSIYWTENNDLNQPFYGLLDARASVRKGSIKLEIWGRNLLNENYGAFYFESFNKSYMQPGKPITFGASLSFTI